MQIRTIDLNSDLGEHDGDRFAADAALLDVVTSANIACGVHAGSRDVMLETIRAASERGVVVGAHPSYPDREGFGRRELDLPLSVIRRSFEQQLTAISECCALEKVNLSYVKPHGALYNRTARDKELAEVIAESVSEFDSTLFVLALSGSELERAAEMFELGCARESFIDRGYMPDGSLVPRGRDGALIHDPAAAAERAVTMVIEGRVQALDGASVEIRPDSLCVHGDGANALETLRLARKRIEDAGFAIAPFVRR